jgi:hypothetical protein
MGTYKWKYCLDIWRQQIRYCVDRTGNVPVLILVPPFWGKEKKEGGQPPVKF